MKYFETLYIVNPNFEQSRLDTIIKDVEKARTEIAKLIGAEKEEIVFTSGATESNNLAIKGMLSKIRRGKNHFITLNTEHKCVLEALRKVELEGAKVSILRVKKNGIINIKQLIDTIQSNTVMVSVMMANNETGVIQPIEKKKADAVFGGRMHSYLKAFKGKMPFHRLLGNIFITKIVTTNLIFCESTK